MFSDAVDEITNADIPHATRTNALRLLRQAHPDNGHVALTWSDACALCEVSVGTLRRQLGQLAAAHLVHYSTNGDGFVYCTFKAWIRQEVSKNSTVDARGRAGIVEKFDSDQPPAEEQARVDAREVSKNSTVDARGRAVDARALTREHAPDLEGRKEGNTLHDSSFLPSFPPPASREEAARSLKLLRDDRVHLFLPHANELAGRFSFQVIRDHVGAWFMNRKAIGGPLESPGCVYTWLTKAGRAVRNSYDPAEWRKTDLYRDYRTPQEVAAGETGDQDGDEAERRRKYIPDDFSDIAIG
jgi:hypothetical protein